MLKALLSNRFFITIVNDVLSLSACSRHSSFLENSKQLY